MEMFLLKMFQIFPMALFQFAFTFACFLLYKWNLEFFGVRDQRLRLMLSEIAFAIQEIYLQYPDIVVIIGLTISFFSLRCVRFKWAIINIIACLTMPKDMVQTMIWRMLLMTSAMGFVYVHTECIRLLRRRPRLPEGQIPLEQMMLLLDDGANIPEQGN
ncbi:uncharacterized protein LOC126469550 [Schistocerca serialis cubense]|uniref:uncharacterized protein LOC126469550 n=1 Tax=Schistocerca serialis cubense TaxID=2023355 RepID=UPI00214E00DA|nr:uncharacterized protein LOC126469550 [Schistocerca serialis cubense]